MSIETEKMNLRSTLKALEFKRSRLSCKMANDVGITGYFFSDELPFDDPRLNPKDVEKYQNLSDRIYDATWKLSKLEYINEPERHVARQNCFDFINLLSLEDSVRFLRKVGCLTTTELVEKLIQHPTLIEEVVLNE